MKRINRLPIMVLYLNKEYKMNWISVKNKKPVGKCLVYLEDDFFDMRIHTAQYMKKLAFIAGHFDFGLPKVTYRIPLPEGPVETI
ncbi:MAG: hypothetical protein PHU71_06335 [Candidatus Gracilibacteria bacterium]|nr:hypothetical protein [Candidatus Gracilibacteria bacterium]